MARQVATIYIDETSIRLLAADKKGVRKWAEKPLDPGMVSDGIIVQEAAVAASVKELLKAMKVAPRKVIAGLSGLHCLPRVIALPRLPKSLLGEAVKREAQRVIPVPLDHLYLAWQVIPGHGPELQVFLVAMPRNGADSLIKTLRQAGINPHILDLKPLALARLADRDTAIVADIQATEVDIVVIVDKVPQLMRTIPLPAEDRTHLKRLSIVEEEMDRTIKFYNTSHPEQPLSPDTPILVSGELAKQSTPDPHPPELKPLGLAQDAAQDTAIVATRPLPSPLACPPGLDLSRYMINIGLAMNGLSPRGANLINLNVLPDAYRPRPRPLTEIVFVPSLTVAVALLVPLLVLVQYASAHTDALRTQLKTTSRINLERQAQKKELGDLKKKADEAIAARDATGKVLAYFTQSQENINRDLGTASSMLNLGITMNNLSHTGDRLTIGGTAFDERSVLDYALSLRESRRFSQVIVANISLVKGETVFRLLLIK